MSFLALTACLVLGSALSPQEDGTPWDSAQVRDYVRPSERERGFQKIHWHSSLIEAMAEARAQDKPLFLWLYFGDPRHTTYANGLRSRQFVCSDPAVVERMQDFVAYAGSDVDLGLAWQKDRLEYKVVMKMFETAVNKSLAPHAPFEGHWMMTSTGTFLAGSTGEESLRSSSTTLAAMREALFRYQRTPFDQRVLAFEPVAERDGLDHEWRTVHRPDSLLDLEVVSRFARFPGASVEDPRHPAYPTFDHLWFRDEEAKGFLPLDWAVGSRTPVSAVVLERLVRLHLGTQVPAFRLWTAEEASGAELLTELVSLEGDLATLRFTGRASLDAPGAVHYEPELRGAARFDRAAARFVEFELVAKGPLRVDGKVKSLCRGAPEADLCVLFQLAERADDSGLPPFHWDTGYPNWITQR